MLATARGYAFSGAKGQDRLVTGRFEYGLSKILFGENVVGRKSEFFPVKRSQKARINKETDLQGGKSTINEVDSERSMSSASDFNRDTGLMVIAEESEDMQQSTSMSVINQEQASSAMGFEN